MTSVLILLFLVLKDKGYTTLQDEAIKIFNSLQQLESMSDPIPIIQGILQTGHDLRPLRDELYCQLIKQTNKVPHPGSVGNLYSWQILACLSCTFLPSRGILKYLKFHLKRYQMRMVPYEPTHVCNLKHRHARDKLRYKEQTGACQRAGELGVGERTQKYK